MTYDIISVSENSFYKISVVIPVYNSEKYLSATLTSILDQAMQGIEIVLVDDGSTDGSEKIIKHFLTDHHHITFVKQKNAGPGAARNAGIELAKGEYISFVDSDDLLPEDALEISYHAAKQENAEIVTGASISFNSTRTWYIPSHANKGVYNPGAKTLMTHPELLYSVGPCNKLFKASLIKDLAFPTGIHVTEDQPFIIEAYLKANKIYSTDHIIYKYRRRESDESISLSQSVKTKALSAIQDIMASINVSDLLWDKYVGHDHRRYYIQAYYYHRLMLADIWPAIINALRNNKTGINDTNFAEVVKWIHRIDKSVYNHLEEMGSASRLKSILAMEEKKSVFPVKKQIFVERLLKLKNLCKQLLKNFIIRRIVYPIFKKKPIENKVLFISAKITTESESTWDLKADINKVLPNIPVKIYLKKRKTFKTLFSYFYDLATAKYIIKDDYTEPFQHLNIRHDTIIIDKKNIKRINVRTEVATKESRNQ